MAIQQLFLITKRLFFLIFLFFSFSYPNILKRDLVYSNLYETKHFNIYWGDDIPLNDIWLSEKEDLPLFIYTLANLLEKRYNFFLEHNLTLPLNINVYVLNTNLKAINPPLSLNNISSLGAFTSDEYPEILINANIESIFYKNKFISYKDRLDSIILHELMHVYQYNLGLIKEEGNNSNLWFIEGTATTMQFLYSNDFYYKDIFINYLSSNINKGFLYDDYFLSYSAGLFFEYIINNYNLTIKDLYDITFDNKKDFFYKLSNILNKNIHQLFYEFYNYLGVGNNNGTYIEFGGAYKVDENATYYIKGFKPKNLIKNDFLVGEGYIEKREHKEFNLNIKKGWNIYITPYFISEEKLNEFNGIIWLYNNGNWSCRGNEDINDLCKKYFSLIKYINPNEGFWLYSDDEYEVSIDINMSQNNLFFNKGWNLTGNILDKKIEFNKEHLIWKYNKKWFNNLESNITINPLEGFWIKK